jgi:2-oxoglutarate ferredoxin oxidoreductase subunit gamma
MVERIIIAGAGGQGIMLLGKILAEAAMREKRFVTYLPSYGAEVRGGTSHCTVAISDKEIGSPYAEKADTLIIMNAPSLERFKSRLKPQGLLMLNSSLITKYAGKKTYVLRFPFSEMAIRLGNIMVANVIALGCYIAHKELLGLNTIARVMEDTAPEAKKDLIAVNKRALEEGAKLR